MNKVLFIANIGSSNEVPSNGVAVKNRHILKHLSNQKKTSFKIVNTYKWKIRFLPLFIKILMYSLTHKKIILSIDPKSAYYIIKFLYIFNLNHKLIYIVVGGSLPSKFKDNSFKLLYFKKIYKIFVQTNRMEVELKDLGLENVSKLSNSKYFNELELKKRTHTPEVIKCFYLGRIHPDKGIDMIFDALKEVNNDELHFTIDFFGQIKENYEKHFYQEIEKNNFSEYKGIIDLFNNSDNYKKLSQYDLFIFPTYWSSEGFPGVVLDSFISGVPVLASDWNDNGEIIESGYNGLLFKSKDNNDLINKLNYINDNKHLLSKWSENAQNSSKLYKTENVLKALDDII